MATDDVFLADASEKELLVAADPEKFFSTPHYAGYPAMLVRLHAIDPVELRELIVDSWLHRAPPKVLRLHGDDVVRSTGR